MRGTVEPSERHVGTGRPGAFSGWTRPQDISALEITLYGGTAAALQLGHRQSVDFDFFTANPLDEDALITALPFLKDATPLQRRPDTLTVQVSPLGPGTPPVKLSFFENLNFGRVGEPKLTTGGELLVASRLDLLGHKLKVLLQRVEAKGYRDIACLLRSGLRIEAGLGAAHALFRSMFPVEDAARALTYFGDGDLATLPPADKDLLRATVAGRGPTADVKILSHDLTIPHPDRLELP